ncbi:hypothetical protein Tsubulata_013520 [Turnera subulata]|nr:hypothetical protein Tsubulata_013520 [Turnera subulata]
MATTASRESRRRKIVERGADRLALITGRIDTLPSGSSRNPVKNNDSSEPLVSHGSPPQPSDHTAAVFPNGDGGVDSTLISPDQTTDDASHGGSHVETPSLLEQGAGIEAARASVIFPNGKDGGAGSTLPSPGLTADDAGLGGSHVETPPQPEQGARIETARASASDFSSNLQSSSLSSVDRRSTVSNAATEQHPRQRTMQTKFPTPNQVSGAIAATERSRMLCSVVVAFLVVLSYRGFPFLGSSIVRSITGFRPFYLVFLTNLTLVLVRVLFNDQRGSQRVARAEYQVPSTGQYNWALQAGNALEMGLVVQKATDAVFMDFSIYAITLICGLCLV